MPFSVAVRRWLADDGAIIYECRHCGTAVESIEQQCPTCESTEIVTFDIS